MLDASRNSMRALALVALLGGGFAAAHAGGGVSVGVNLGLPLVGAYGAPVGSIGLQVGGSRGGRGGWRHHGHRGGLGLGLGLMIGVPLFWPSVVYEQPVVVVPPPSAPPPPSRLEPMIYPRLGQDAQQTEADRQACDRWATTQPAALADAAVFMRAVEACMDARGYTVR